MKKLEIQGVGFKAAVQGAVNMTLGYLHPINYPIPDQIKVTVEEKHQATIEGPDKQVVGQVASELRSFTSPEPYKGKGVRYVGEHVQRKKEGKTVPVKINLRSRPNPCRNKNEIKTSARATPPLAGAQKRSAAPKERPRMSVFFSNENIHVQFFDDAAGNTLAAAYTLSNSTPDKVKLGANVKSAKTIGTLAAKTALDKGIKTVVFGSRRQGVITAR